jgi:hypothetical protein
VKYWAREFKAQRTDLHNEVWPGRPLIEVSTQIARLLNNESFSSTCHLARQLVVTKEVVKGNLRKSWGSTNLVWSGRWTSSVRNKRQSEYKCLASYITISFLNDRKILPQSSPGTSAGIIGFMRNRRCRHDHTMMFQQGHFRKLVRKSRRSQYFQRWEICLPWFFIKRPEYGFLPFLQHCSGRGQSRGPCWNTKSDSERFPYPYGQL